MVISIMEKLVMSWLNYYHHCELLRLESRALAYAMPVLQLTRAM